VGEVYEHRPGKTFTAEEGMRHALQYLEQSPRLTDLHFNRALNGERVLINEAYVVGAVSALTTKTFDKVLANLAWTNVVLPRPVYGGDTVYAQSTILDKRESHSRPEQGILHVLTEVSNQDEELVCRFERTFLVYRKGFGPYDEAGY
jgi:itaconyl-CoA hydratase